MYYSLIIEGDEYALTPSNGIHGVRVSGAGMPPIDNIRIPYGLADGSIWQRHTVKDRLVTLTMMAHGQDAAALHAIRAGLIHAVNPHRAQPVTLRYYGDETLDLHCYYDGGLEGNDDVGPWERLGLRLFSPDPYWYATAPATGSLDPYQTIAVGHIAERNAIGEWGNMGGGLSAGGAPFANVALYGPDGNLYVGGIFTAAGGEAAADIAKWDGSTWSALGTGLNDQPYALAFGPDGKLYVAGAFTAAGGSAAYRIAVWDGSTWSTLGAGLNDAIWALAVGPDGALYAAGEFTDLQGGGGTNLTRVAKWDGSAWSALDIGINGIVHALTIGPDGSLYAGGAFTAAGSNAANRIAVWDGSAWAPLGAGMDAEVRALAFTPDGILWAGGYFTTADGQAANHIARWNGTAWGRAGTFNDTVFDLHVREDGALMAVGAFTASGYGPITSWAERVGNAWLPGDGLFVSGSFYPTTIDTYSGKIAIGGYLDVTIAFPGYQTITNPGSARAYPVITLEGPGRLYHIINHSTGHRLDFDLTLLDGEALTIDLRPGVKTITSSFRGNLLRSLLPSDLVAWCLAPGDNYVAVWIDDALASGSYSFTPTYWSIDGSAA